VSHAFIGIRLIHEKINTKMRRTSERVGIEAHKLERGQMAQGSNVLEKRDLGKTRRPGGELW